MRPHFFTEPAAEKQSRPAAIESFLRSLLDFTKEFFL